MSITDQQLKYSLELTAIFPFLIFMHSILSIPLLACVLDLMDLFMVQLVVRHSVL